LPIWNSFTAFAPDLPPAQVPVAESACNLVLPHALDFVFEVALLDQSARPAGVAAA